MPGPIVITATFVGYFMALLPGAVVGTASIFTPSLILLTAIDPCFDLFENHALFRRMMHGVLVSFVGLLFSVAIRFAFTIHWNVYQIVMAILALAALRVKVDILLVVLVGAALSVFLL